MRALGILGVFAVGVFGCGQARKSTPGTAPNHDGGDPNLPSAAAGGETSEAGSGSGGTSGSSAGVPNATGGSANAPSGGSGGTGSGGRAGSGGRSPAAGTSGTAGTTGGSGTAGSSGAAGAGGRAPVYIPTPAIWEGPLPSECQEVSSDAGADACLYELSCSDAVLTVQCWLTGDGIASCTCYDGYQSLDMGLGQLTGFEACAVAAEFCGSGQELDFGGPEECSETLADSDETSCTLQETCLNTLEAGDATAQVKRARSIACVESEDESAWCACGDGMTDFRIEDADAAAVCSSVIDLCDAPPSLDNDGPVECDYAAQVALDTYCQTQASCIHEIPMQAGITALLREVRNAQCTEDAVTDGSSCSCSSAWGALSFRQSSEVESVETCNAIMKVCTGPDSLRLSAQPTFCAASNTYASDRSCFADFECTQDATLGPLPVQVRAKLGAECSEADGNWSCLCKTGARAVQTGVSASDGLGACAEAAVRCPAVLPPEYWTRYPR